MIAISKKNTTKLIKGQRYTVEYMWNSGKNVGWREGKVHIKEVGSIFDVKNFTDINGNPLPNIDILPTTAPRVNQIKFEDVKEGEILVCTSNKYKSFVKGKMYKIEMLIVKEVEKLSWDGNKRIVKDHKIKFEGCRMIDFPSWWFRKLTLEESRNMALSRLVDGVEPEILKKKARKIEHTTNKTKELIVNLFKSIIDENRHVLSIVDWTIKINRMDIEKSDFDEILNLPLKDILQQIEENETK